MTLKSDGQGHLIETDTGQRVVLVGADTWDNGPEIGYASFGAFNFNEFIDHLSAAGGNFTRMWAPVGADDNSSGAGNVLVAPFTQNADGKWDLTQYNDQYFQNLASQLDYAAGKGVYVQVMLFADYNVPYGGGTWAGSFWNGGNNVNGTTSDNVALDTLGGGAPLDLQEAYIAKVLDTIAGRTNVMLEIANEPPPGTVPWQNALADFIHSYQSSHGLPANPVVESATFPHFGSENDNAALLNSPADVVELDHWQSTPGNSIYDLPGPGAKPEIVMTDHSGTEADSSAMCAAVGKGYGWEIMGVPNNWGFRGSWEAIIPATMLLSRMRSAISLLSVRVRRLAGRRRLHSCLIRAVRTAVRPTAVPLSPQRVERSGR